MVVRSSNWSVEYPDRAYQGFVSRENTKSGETCRRESSVDWGPQLPLGRPLSLVGLVGGPDRRRLIFIHRITDGRRRTRVSERSLLLFFSFIFLFCLIGVTRCDNDTKVDTQCQRKSEPMGSYVGYRRVRSHLVDLDADLLSSFFFGMIPPAPASPPCSMNLRLASSIQYGRINTVTKLTANAAIIASHVLQIQYRATRLNGGDPGDIRVSCSSFEPLNPCSIMNPCRSFKSRTIPKCATVHCGDRV